VFNWLSLRPSPALTAWTLIALVGVAVAYDAWAYLETGYDATFSNCIQGWCQFWPPLRLLLAFVAGAIVAHLLWE
jgi:hypothetical protein